MASLIERIATLRKLIRSLTILINECSNTAAGRILKQEYKEDRDNACHTLGYLVANSGVKICLQ